jgi:large subunit ribosomal protein L9
MKVILTKDVAKVGRRHEIKDLANGFARNFIIARGLGVMADAKNLAKLKTEGVEKVVQNDLLNQLLIDLSGKVIKLEAKANDKGHLFASIHLVDILKALKQQHRLEIPETMVIYDDPIKAIGEHEIKIKSSAGIGKLKVEIVKKDF